MQVSASTEEKTEISEDFGEMLRLNVSHEVQLQESGEEQGESEEEFSFACASPGDSPISADDAFVDGRIRPIFPVFDQRLLYNYGDGVGGAEDDSKKTLRPPLKKLFIEEEEVVEEEEERSDLEEEQPVGPFCDWSSGGHKTVKEASPEPCKKSNSTGFSKIWRFREHVLRSNSDGKDAFVFLNNNDNKNDGREREIVEKSSKRPEKSSQKPAGCKTTPGQKTSNGEKGLKLTTRGNNSNNNKKKKGKAETMSSVYEKYYVRNRVMKEGNQQRTHAPYKQDLVGFLANVNGFSRNVHPF